MKKIYSIASMFLLATSISYAQVTTRVSGNVKDAAGKGIINAGVSLLQATDSSLVKADIADADGQYELAVPGKGKYLVRSVMSGYETVYSDVFTLADGDNYHVPDMIMPNTTTHLKDVTITSKKPMIEVKADKMVFNVENSINATGSNAMELLRKSPGVMVDNNENISMKGKTGVKIYIDGKMSQLDAKDLAAYLKSINSNDIEAIEMISNPSAKYDASGNAGIVNIRLKKNKKYGTNGSANINYIQGITPKANGSVNLNYRNNKVNLFGNIGGDIGRNHGTLNLDRYQNDTGYIQRTSDYHDNKGVNIKAGIDYFLNSKNTLGFLVTTNYNENTWVSQSNTVIYNPSGAFVKTLRAYNTVPGYRTNNNVNLNYKYTDTNGRELNIDADYGLFRGKGNSLQPNYYLDGNNNPIYTIVNRNITPTDIDIYTVKADWEQKLGKGKLGLGAKMSYVRTDNAFDFFNVVNNESVKVLDRSNSFRYTENVNAAYVNYNRQLSKKVSLQAGVRVENTGSKGELTRADGIRQSDDTVTKNYTDLFPSAALTWNMSAKHSLNLTYSRRIDRPTYQDLNPFENKLDELSYEKGNAFLRPQYTNTIELTHTFMGFINTTLGYSHVSDYATQLTDTVKNASYIQQRNLATVNIYSFSIGSPLQFTKWLSGYANVWYNYQAFEGKIGQSNLKASVPSYGAYLQQAFILGNDYSAEISGWFNGPSVWGATWLTDPQGGVDVGIQKQFWKKTASLKLTATDIFYTAPWKANVNFGGLRISGNGSWESRTVRLSFSYRFGSSQISSARERKTGLESESSRIKGK